MDEPTNHLDIVSKDTIEKLLKNYKGSVIVVSHDRYLIKNVCNKVLALENEIGTIYNGYLDYLEKRNPQTNQTPNLNSSIKKEKNLKCYIFYIVIYLYFINILSFNNGYIYNRSNYIIYIF